MKNCFEFQKVMSEVGFEPTPSNEDQNTLPRSEKKDHLESGALDHSAILTCSSIRNF